MSNIDNNGVIQALDNIWTLFKSNDSYFVLRVIAYHYNSDESKAFLTPVHLMSGDSFQESDGNSTGEVIFTGSKEDCLKRKDELESGKK